MSESKISETQWRVMEVIWGRGEATAADVIEVLLPETGWNHQTVRTLLARLVNKGVLEAHPVRNYYVYKPLVRREDAIREEEEAFLGRLFNGSADELLVYFVREGKVGKETLDKLQRMIDENKTRKSK